VSDDGKRIEPVPAAEVAALLERRAKGYCYIADAAAAGEKKNGQAVEWLDAVPARVLCAAEDPQ